MSLIEFHARLGNTAILFMLVCGLWGTISYLRGQPVSSSYAGTLVIGEGLLLLQAAIGMGLLLAAGRPGRGIHILYGVLTALCLPGAFVYTKGRRERVESLIYGLVTFFVFGLALRAMTTA